MALQSQLVFVPCPGMMGHLGSIVKFAELLINHHHHLSVTLLLLIKAPFDHAVESYIPSLSSSGRLHFIILPDPHPNPINSHHHSLHISSVLDSLIETQKPNVRDAVSKLSSAPDSPRLAGFVVDMFCTTMIDVASEFQVPAMVFFTLGAAFLGFKLQIHKLRERGEVDTTAFNFTNSGAEFAVPSFENHVPANVFPSVMLDEEWARFFFSHARRYVKANGLIVNTFEELESHAVHSFSNSDLTVYPVGPILSISGDSNTVPRGSDHVMEWLDDQPPSSVLFLCFGSAGYFDEEEENHQVREIARALEASGVHFVWSLRKPPPKGKVEGPGDYSIMELEGVLPEAFLERTAERGRVVGWAPQAQILAHKAVGGFVSHCGWNSVLESIHYGVPIAAWPLYAEQQTNAFELVRELKMSVEMSLDYRAKWGNVSKSGLISAERIEEGIKQVMQEESEVRKKVKEMSEMSKRALMEGGSSYSYLARFIHDILN